MKVPSCKVSKCLDPKCVSRPLALRRYSFLKLRAWEAKGAGGVFLLEVQYSILKSLISTCVLSYVGSREDWLLDRICESEKDCWDSIRRTSYPYQ